MRFFSLWAKHLFVYLPFNLLKMKIKVNNKEVETGASNLLILSQELELPQTGIAVAVNNRMIPRTEWEQFVLNENDELVIIKAVCGG